MPTNEISIEKAKKDKLFYFVANVVVYREEDGRCLLLKRHTREKAHPGKYTTPGGKLEWNNLDIHNPTRINGNILDYEGVVEDLLVRETHEEAGIEIHTDVRYLESVAFIRPDGIPVVLVKFAARYKCGDVILEEHSFTDHVWVNENEVKEYDTIDGIPREISATVALFKRNAT